MTNIHPLKKLPTLASLALLPCLGHGAALEEIVVTARKAQESLQSTPVAVSALTQEMLIEAQVTEIADLRRTAPNLSIMTAGTGPSTLTYMAIRGMAQVSPGGTADAAVGTYIDGVYYARPTGGNVDMFDVSQAEILRGPQGTLFGRNTTGGALNIRTNDPADTFEGYLKGGIGNYGSHLVEGVVNIPLVQDELAARFAYKSSGHDNYGDYRGYRNNTPGSTLPSGFHAESLGGGPQEVEKNYVGRAKFRWTPSDLNFEAVLGLDWGEFKDTGNTQQVVALNPNSPMGLIIGGIGFDLNQFLQGARYGDSYAVGDNSAVDPNFLNGTYNKRLGDPQASSRFSGAYLDLDIDLGSTQLKSISSYREMRTFGMVDLDGLPLNSVNFASVYDQEQWSQEFQLSGTFGEKLDWITGLYYFQENSYDYSRGRNFSDLYYADLATLTGNPAFSGIPFGATGAKYRLSSNEGFAENTSTGVFAQANYAFTEALRGTIGLRYTLDKREVDITSQDPIPGQGVPAACKSSVTPDVPGICSQKKDVDYDYPAWVASLDYQVSDALFIYAKTSGASMSGGWNIREGGVPSFAPEDVMDFELGFKSDLLADSLRVNGALFWWQAEDQQRFINAFLPEARRTTQYVINAGKSQATGAELEITWLPWNGMTLNTSLSLLDVEYDEFETPPVQAGASPVDRSDEKAPHAPELTYSAGATQTFQTGLGELDIHVDYYWVDKTYFSDDILLSRANRDLYAVPDYGLWNAQATLHSGDGHWEISLWGKNLADEEYYKNVINYAASIGVTNRVTGDPRTYGATVKYNW